MNLILCSILAYYCHLSCFLSKILFGFNRNKTIDFKASGVIGLNFIKITSIRKKFSCSMVVFDLIFFSKP